MSSTFNESDNSRLSMDSLAAQVNRYRFEDRKLLDEREFHFVLNKERLRADRRAIPFVLLVFEGVGESAKPIPPDQYGMLLMERLRFTDEVGHFDANRLGVILTDSPEEDGEQVAQSLKEHAAEKGLGLVYEMFAYPPQNRRQDKLEILDSKSTPTKKPIANAKPLERLFERPPTVAKRVFDVSCSVFALIVLAPVMAITALLIKLTSPGPVFYFQLREGQGGRKFWMYKFRSMRINAHEMQAKLRHMNEQDGPAFKIKNDPRFTPIGKLLRKASIDELPQLVNILRGEMSIVGPRPLPVAESEACTQWQRRRLDILPGLTCTWQAFENSGISFADWMRLDIRYIKQSNLRFDLRLIWQTVFKVLSSKGSG